MEIDRFTPHASGKLVKVGKGPAAYQAFVPGPLPPQLIPDWELAGLISAADRSLSELSGLGRMLPNPALFISPFLRREAVLSSRIEGTRSDITDLYFYESGQLPLPGLERTPPPEEDLKEVLNYVNALEYGFDRLKTLPVSLRLLRELHARLLQGVRGEYASVGEFRTTQNWIGGYTINEAVFVPPPPSELVPALDAFEKYLYVTDSYPPLVRLAFIHYQFEAIHPFVDGNGRIGRLLLSLLMVSWNLSHLPLLYLSAYFESHRQEYYDLLLAVSQRGAWREWVTFFLQGVASQAQDTLDRARRMQDLQIAWRSQLQQSRTSGLVLGIIDLLFSTPVISAGDIRQNFGVTHTAAMSVLRKLEQSHILREFTGKERHKRYIADEILRIIQ
jgi:Fic family protein